MSGLVQDAVERVGWSNNGHGVERIATIVVPQLRSACGQLPACATTELLGEVIELLGLVAGCAADGARTAYAIAPDRSGR